jgi:hypothetical protein
LASSSRAAGARFVAPILMMPGMDGVANAYTHPVIARFFFFGSVPSEKEKKG